MSTVDWLAEMEIEDATFFDGAKLLDELTPEQIAASFDEDLHHLYSTEGFGIDSHPTMSSPSLGIEVPQVCCDTPTKRSISEAASFSDLVSLHKLNSNTTNRRGDRFSAGYEQYKSKATEGTNNASQENAPKTDRGCKRGNSPITESHSTKEHVIAERKRRAKLSQQFIALTAIVPGIKKMDKATVLDDSIKYLKHLQERVKSLEEKNSKKSIESAVFVKKYQVHSDSESGSSDENFTNEPQPLPQIEARVSHRNVLIRIHCEKNKGVLVKALEETEKLNLSVVNSSVIPFGNSTLDITLLAQMDGGFVMTVKDLVRSLRSSLIQFDGKEPSTTAL